MLKWRDLQIRKRVLPFHSSGSWVMWTEMERSRSPSSAQPFTWSWHARMVTHFQRASPRACGQGLSSRTRKNQRLQRWEKHCQSEKWLCSNLFCSDLRAKPESVLFVQSLKPLIVFEDAELRPSQRVRHVSSSSANVRKKKSLLLSAGGTSALS